MMPHLADINAAKFTPEVVAELLADYTESARRVILSEAEIWRYGDVESARRTYDEMVTWARLLTREDRVSRKWGYWHANMLLECAAIGEVQKALGEV